MRRKLIITAALVILFSTSIFGIAQNPQIKVEATVDPDTALVGDTVTYTVALTGANLPDTITPDVPGLNNPGIQVLSTSQNRAMMSGSSFTLIVNGRTVKQDKNAEEQVIIEYVLRLTSPGSFHIGPASVDIGGNNYKSNEVAFNVSTEPIAPQGVKTKGDIFLHTEVSANRVYVGQQVTLKYYLYVRSGLDIDQLLNWEMPRMDGFIKNDVERPGKFRGAPREIGGQAYEEVFLGRQVVFPISSGQRIIGPSKLEYIQTTKGSIHPIFGRQYQQQKGVAESEPVTIEATPLPDAGRPADFSGAVGRFQVQAEADRREARAGESITLTVTLAGTGNLKSASDPVLNIPTYFQTYPPEKQDQAVMVGEEVQSSRKLKVILVPQQEGTFTVGPVTYSYFDPESGSYQQTASQAISITVSAGVIGSTRPNITLPEGEEVKLLGHDIKYIKPDAVHLHDYSKPYYTRPWYWALHGLPLLVLAGAVLIRRRQDRLIRDVGYARRVRARTASNQSLSKASHSLKTGDISGFYLALNEALLGYIADNLDLMAAGLTSAEIFSKMTEAGAPPEVVASAIFLLERCDAARYAPSASSKQNMGDDLEEARRLIEELSRAFDKGKKK